MQYFTPIFQLATLAPPQSHLRSKIGGIPWGLPPHLWPSCCNHPQKLLAQLLHDPPFLDLGHPSAILHLFQCLECCGIGYDGRGRAAFLTARAELSNTLTTVPGYDDQRQCGGPLIAEAFITGWQTHDDQIPASRLPEFFDDHKKYSLLMEEYSNIDWFDCRESTKFSGSPRWTGNGPMDFPPPPFEFLFQLNSYLFIDGPEPAPDALDSDIHPNAPWYGQYDPDKKYYYFAFTNLAFDGTLFTFINRNTHPHSVQWFLNR